MKLKSVKLSNSVVDVNIALDGVTGNCVAFVLDMVGDAVVG